MLPFLTLMRRSIRHRPTPRGPTPRRLVAAKSAIEKERQRLVLFDGQVESEQETAHERIARFDADLVRAEQGHRDLAARHWRQGRRQLATLSAETCVEVTTVWNRSSMRATASCFANFVRTALKSRSLPITDDA